MLDCGLADEDYRSGFERPLHEVVEAYRLKNNMLACACRGLRVPAINKALHESVGAVSCTVVQHPLLGHWRGAFF